MGGEAIREIKVHECNGTQVEMLQYQLALGESDRFMGAAVQC